MTRNSKGFDARLSRVTKRHHGARSLFDSALEELEAAQAGFELLEKDVEAEIDRLRLTAAEAAAGRAQANRVSQKIRDLLS
jgi:hypothetical protein